MVPAGGSLRARRFGVACLIAAATSALAAAAQTSAHAAPALAASAQPSDPLAAARRLKERAPSLAPLAPAATGITRDEGPLAIIEHDGSDYSRLEPDGTPNYAARARVTRAFYAAHGDRYDFVVVFTNFPFDQAGAVGFHNLVRNDVAGIGLPAVNNGPLFGSPGRLLGVVDMGPVDQFRGGGFSTEPGQPGFRAAVDVLAHEIGHQWLARVRYRDAGGAASADLLGLDESHWSYLLDSDASLVYGSDWLPAGGGVFRASRVQQAYSSLDLYLMGLLDPARVRPFTLLRNPAVSASQLPDEGATVTATPEEVAIEQVIAAEGARVPDHRASPKDFRIGFVVLAGPGLDPTAEDLDAVNRLRAAFEARFFALTRGVAFADTTLEEEPPPPPAPTADLDRALAWLKTRQALDGRWEDAPGTALRDTAAVLDALDASGDASTTSERGRAWIAAASAPNLDFLARRARAIALAPIPASARDALVAAVLAHRNADGGFGAASGYESDAFDTALALRALRDLGWPADGPVRAALGALARLQIPEGGWALVPGRGPSTMAIAQVLLALQDWADVPEAAALTPAAIAALAGRQNEDGGFGESPSTAHGTALALLALDRAGAPSATLDPAVAWLQRTQLSEGSWNGRTYETALALAALKGQTAPNLVVRQDDFVLDPASAREGEVVQARARVRNVGRLASPASTARLYLGAPLEANAVATSAIPALDAGQDALVVLEFPTADRPGTHLLSVRADADGVVGEVREDDNTASRSLVVEGPLADLAVRPSDIVIAPYPPEAGETVQVTVTVTNRGDREAAPTVLRLFRGQPGGGGTAIGQAALPAITPGAAVPATLDWLANGPPGSTVVAAMADAAYGVIESDETNNAAFLPVTITGPVGPGPDLEVPRVEVEPTVLTALPETAAVRVVVRNVGRDPASSTIALFEGSPVAGVLVAEQPLALGPRASTLVTIPFPVTTSGTRTLTAIADRASLLDETNEANNQAAAVLRDPRNTLDVAVTQATPIDADLVVGETLSVSATVRNRGTLPVSEVPVVLAGADGSLGELDRERVTLTPGEAATVTLTWVTSVTADALPLAVVADPFGLLAELDEANNRREFTVQVRASGLGNLHLSGAGISIDPDPPLEGGQATVRARVHNTGAVPVGPFVVRFHRGDPAGGGLSLGEVPLAGVAGQGEVIAEIPWSPVTIAGAAGLYVVADALGQVAEYDETDNVGFRPFQVVGLADLSASSAELSLEPAFPRAGQPVAIRAIVRNLGHRPAAASTLRVFEGEPPGGTPVAESSVPPLPPGQSATVELTWTPASDGERLLAVMADADSVVLESDEGNNLARRDVVVQDPDFFATAPYFSPDGDGVQDETVVAYRASGPVEILVSDARGHRVRTLVEGGPAQGTAAWDGRDDRGRLLWDGTYSLTLRAAQSVLARVAVVLDTNRNPIHEAAGTGFVALRTIDASQTNARGPAWMPAEDEVLLILPVDAPSAGLSRGLLRWRFDGTRTYVAQDDWYDLDVQFASPDPVSPHGAEVLVIKGDDLIAVDLVTGARRSVAPGGSRVTWSPDGTRILVWNQVYSRQGELLATLPFGAGTWSPDGSELLSGLERIRNDGSDPRTIPLPIEIPDSGALGQACFAGSTWRGDGRIALHIGRLILVGGGGGDGSGTIECGAERVFVYDPELDESIEAVNLRGVPPSPDWSPDGSRVFHPARAGRAREVTHESSGPSLQIWPSEAWVTPRSTAAYFCTVGNEACGSYVDRLSAVTNLLNLTADLAPTPLPGSSGVLLKGTATDVNLDRWQVDFATAASPTEWHPIGPASSAPVVDSLLATWVPSAPGTYIVRLSVWDRAGGQRTVARIVSWAQTPALANITQSERLISPNGDGTKDVVRFDFLVQEPTRLEARVVGPEPSTGMPGQAPVVRRFSIDLPTIGPAQLAWDGRDAAGSLVPDGRYAVFLNEMPFQVEVDATPPEIALRHDNLRVASGDLVESPGEVLGPTGECVSTSFVVQQPTMDRYWHVVDPHLRHWSHGEERGTQQVYEPERDAEGVIVYEHGVPRVLRQDGRPVDRVELTVHPGWFGALDAEDLAGNVSVVLPPDPPAGVFVMGFRPQPRCLPAGSVLPPTRFLGDVPEGQPQKLTPRTRFFVRRAPSPTEGLKRFEFRASDADPWSAGPQSTLEWADIVDVDFTALGLQPGRVYQGRFVAVGAPETVSDRFEFKLCTEAITVEVEGPIGIAGTSQSRYTVTLQTDLAVPLASAVLEANGEGALEGFFLSAPFERIGPTTYRKTVVAPTTGCSPSGEEAVLEFQARVHGPNGRPLLHDGECVNLKARAGGCDNGLHINEEVLACGTASSDEAVLQVRAYSVDPAALVAIERTEPGGAAVPVGEPYPIGSEQPCGTLPGVNGSMTLYCDERLVTASVAGVPDSVARFRGRLEAPEPPPPPAPPLASSEVDIRIDHTRPAITLFEPPEEGSACVQANGLVENVRLALQVDDAAPAVKLTDASYRFGAGPWRRMCLDQDCGPWDDLPTGSTVERTWDVRGLADGAYDVRLQVCDRAGNTVDWTRRVTIARGGTAIDVASTAHPEFSPNGDGLAEETRASVRLPQTLRLAVEVLSGGPTGAVVRRLGEPEQRPAGAHPFVWDGRTDAGTTAPQGRYAIAATATNACGGTDASWVLVDLDLTPPAVTIESPAPGAVLETSTDVLGRATDERFESYALSVGAGASPSSWTSIGGGSHPAGAGPRPDPLGVFDPPPAEGPYTLRLVGRDRAENASETRVVVNVAPRAFLERVHVAPDVISPNGDGRRDSAAIEYQLLVAGLVTLEIRNGNGATVRQLETNVHHTPGTFAFAWNGTRDDGAPTPDGAYQVFVSVADPAGVAPAQQQALALAVDRAAPTVSIAQPLPAAFVSTEDLVRGTILDPTLAGYVITAERPFSPPLEIARGTQERIDADLGALAALTNGPYVLVAAAEDRGQNRTEVRVPITLDAVMPQAALESPTPGAVLARGVAPVPVTGSALDANLQSFELAFGAGTAPSYFVPIATGTQPVGSGPLGSWAVAGLADGPFALRLVVHDRAGHSAESRAAVVLDGVAPEARIDAPLADAALNAATTVAGAASDANLASWRLEAAPGEAAAAYQWTVLAESGVSAPGGALATWEPLPADGRHTLRLTVRDHAGHESLVTRTVTVDTVPPALPAPLASTVVPAGTVADVVLTWAPNTEPDLAGYVITRNGVVVSPDPLVEARFTDVGRSEGTYAYALRAVDRAGNASPPRPLPVTVDLTPPTVSVLQPSNGARVSGAVEVRGTAFSANDFAEYRVLTGAGAAPTEWTLVRRSSVPVSASTLAVWTPTQPGPHVLALEAADRAGNTARTTVGVVVDHAAPGAPVLVSVQNLPEATTLTVTWQPVPDPDAAGYLLYRNGRIANAPAVVIGDLRPYLVPGPAHADTALPDGRHCYVVVAMDEAGNLSPPSNEICAVLDHRPPHATLVAPPDGTRFEFPLRLLAATPDLDVAAVRFEVTPAAQAAWSPIAPADGQPPYEAMLDPLSLSPGDYRVRAVAVEVGGREDPAPTPITVTYGDTSAPAPPNGLAVAVDAAVATVGWTAGTEPDLAGYHVYRDGVRLTPTPQPATTFSETLALGSFAYQVTAIDTDGNESLPSSASALVYRLALDAVVPAVTGGPITLTGAGARAAGGTIEVLRSGAVVGVAAPQPGGSFTATGIALAAGPNLLTARERDALGHASVPSEDVVVIANEAPGPIANLTADVSGLQVSLAWDAASDPEVFGYHVRRDGSDVTALVPVVGPVQIVASSSLEEYGPYGAFDGQQDTAWIPGTIDAPADWTIDWSAPRLVGRVDLSFRGPAGPVPAPAHRIEVDWQGRFVPLVSTAGGPQSEVSHVFASPFATTRVRVALGPATFVGLGEVAIRHLALVPAAVPTLVETVPDGVHAYEVTAVDRFGAQGPAASLQVPVGDAEPPPVPLGLQAAVGGSAVTLTWLPVTATDLDGYVVRRDGTAIGSAGVPSFLDANRPNGTFVYTVRARDRVGNESADSSPASAIVGAAPPPAPVLEATAPPTGGVRLAWSHPGAVRFQVQRAGASGGPYVLVAETADVRTYDDSGVRPGAAYHYVVRAFDAPGNASDPSNEVAVTPAAPPPALLRPAVPGTPALLRGPVAGFAGRAWPEAMVALTVNGELRGVAEAGRAFEELESLTVPEGGFMPRVSPDGRTVSYVTSGVDGEHAGWVEWATGAKGAVAAVSVPMAFSPDGRRLAYLTPTCDETSCQGDLMAVGLDGQGISVIENGPLGVLDAAWSPQGDRVAVVLGNPTGVDQRLEVVDVASGASSLAAQYQEGGLSGLRWSPNGEEIALLRWDAAAHALVLESVRVADGSIQTLSDAVGWTVPVWTPTGRTVVYTSVAGARPRVRSWDLDSGVVTDLTGTDRASVDPHVDPTGAWLSYIRYDDASPVGHVLVARSLATGAERDVLRWTSDDPSTSEIHEWVRGGFLAFLVEGRVRLFPSFDGAFHAAAVVLEPGANRVDAEAVEVSTGAVSPASDAVDVTVPLALFPDLEVGPHDLAAYPAVPSAGQPTVLSARVRNLGLAAAASSGVRVTLRGPAGVVIDQATTLAALAPGASGLISVPWTPASPGLYTLRADADSDRQVVESREDNNAAEVELFVASGPGLAVQLGSDRAAYPAHTTARLSVDVANGGPAFAGTLETRVLTPAGALVAAVDQRAVTLSYGQSQHVDLAWNTGTTLAGEHRFEVRALEGEAPRGSAVLAFRIEAHAAAWTRVVPDDPTVPLNASAVLRVRVENRGANTVLAGAVARLAIVPAAGGAVVFAADATVPSLGPGAAWESAFTWPVASPAGAFVAAVQVVDAAGLVAANASAPLEVEPPSSVAFTGSLVLAPSHVLRGGIAQAAATLTNTGSAPAVQHPFAFEVVDGASASVILRLPFALDVPAGSAREVTLDVPTASLAAGPYLVFLRAQGVSASLDRAPLQVHPVIAPPSVDAPPAGGTVATDHPTLRVNNASAPGTVLRYQFELYRDVALTLPLPGAAGILETPAHTSWTVPLPLSENERYFWRARATDGFSNSAWTAVASFLVDAVNEPPTTPAPDTPGPGAPVATLQPMLVVANAFDAERDPLSYDFRVATDAALTQVVASTSGVPEGALRTSWTVPAPLVEDAVYYWSARARDAASASAWSVPISFRVDSENESPSAVPLLRPADDAEVPTLSPELAVGPATDPENDPLVYRIEVDRVPSFDSIQKQVSPGLQVAGAEATWTPPLPLPDNARAYWRASAFDGHTSGPWSYRRFFVNLANDVPGAPTPLEPGAGSVVTTQTPTLRVRNAEDLDEDPLTYAFEVRDAAGDLVASVDGVPQTPEETGWPVGTPLAENGAFTWRARAHDGAASGPWSAETVFRVNATNDPPTAPTPIAPAEGGTVTVPRPELVIANATSPDLLTLTYAFELYRVETGGGLTLVAAAEGLPSGEGQTSWTPAEDLADGAYSWRARASDVHQAGPWMASAHFTVAVDRAPAAPTGLTAVAGDARVHLTWAAHPEPDVVGYRVYRGVVTGGPYGFVGPSTTPAFDDTGLPNGQPFFYVVTAVDATQESPPSQEVSATPTAVPLAAEVVFWPAVAEGECLECPARGLPDERDITSGVQPVVPLLECVRNDGPLGITAFFGFDNPNATPTPLPIGPENAFEPGPPDRGQPVLFPRGRSADHPGAFTVRLGPDPLTWRLDGQAITALSMPAVKTCVLPTLSCPAWLYATIEPAGAENPALIHPQTVRLGKDVAADPTYQALVDRDGDGRLEREVRFGREAVRPLLAPGTATLSLRGLVGSQPFAGGGTVQVAPPKAALDVSPTVLSRSQPGPDLRAWVTLRGCFAGASIDVASIRLNGAVPVGSVLGIQGGVLMLTFDRAAALGVLPLGDRLELVVTGTARGQAFRAVDLVRVIE